MTLTLKDCEVGDIVSMRFIVQERSVGGFTDLGKGHTVNSVKLNLEKNSHIYFTTPETTIIEEMIVIFEEGDKVSSSTGRQGIVKTVIDDRAWVYWMHDKLHSVVLTKNLRKVLPPPAPTGKSW